MLKSRVKFETFFTFLQLFWCMIWDPSIKYMTDPLWTGMNIHDGGEYSCEVETDDLDPTAVVHTVEILGKNVNFFEKIIFFKLNKWFRFMIIVF